MKYIVVTGRGENLDKFVAEVNDLLRDGYSPAGGVMVDHDHLWARSFYQALYLPERQNLYVSIEAPATIKPGILRRLFRRLF